MNRIALSNEYATRCQRVITNAGDDYRAACVEIERIPIPEKLHPMLLKINDLAYDVQENFRGEESDIHSWRVICRVVDAYLGKQWESTAWWLAITYGIERNGIVSHADGVSVESRGGDVTYTSGNELLVNTIKQVAAALNSRQTDELFLYLLVESLPEKIGEWTLQSSDITEIAIEGADDE